LVLCALFFVLFAGVRGTTQVAPENKVQSTKYKVQGNQKQVDNSSSR